MPRSSVVLPRSSMWKNHQIPFTQNRLLHLFITVFVLYWIWTGIHPVDRKDFFLESTLPLIVAVVLAFLYKHFAFNNISYLLITVYLILHLTGAHYAYKYAPIDFWYKSTFHSEHGISDWIVHFSFGLLMVYPLQDILIRLAKTRLIWIHAIIFSIIMAASAIFEILEMLVGLVANPQLAEQYLGLQGDVLDTQKDMLMALIGSLISIGWLVLQRRDSWEKEEEHAPTGMKIRVR